MHMQGSFDKQNADNEKAYMKLRDLRESWDKQYKEITEMFKKQKQNTSQDHHEPAYINSNTSTDGKVNELEARLNWWEQKVEKDTKMQNQNARYLSGKLKEVKAEIAILDKEKINKETLD